MMYSSLVKLFYDFNYRIKIEVKMYVKSQYNPLVMYFCKTETSYTPQTVKKWYMMPVCDLLLPAGCLPSQRKVRELCLSSKSQVKVREFR